MQTYDRGRPAWPISQAKIPANTEEPVPNLHIAQVNIARMKAPLEDPVMAGFVARLEEINALADRSPGFVWRLQTTDGNATYLRPYGDDRILFAFSVGQTVEQLERYVYYAG